MGEQSNMAITFVTKVYVTGKVANGKALAQMPVYGENDPSHIIYASPARS